MCNLIYCFDGKEPMLDSVWRRLKQKLCHPKKKYDQKNKINKIGTHQSIDR